jgi:large subunit ribosomal protein L22
VAVASTDRETIRARARHVRMSARKARLVLEHIRGKQASEAREILGFHTRAAARDAGKVLASAIANAEYRGGHDADDLIVLSAYADEGPTIKRWRARARGRVNRIEKRTCHITIELAVAEPGEIKRKARPAPAPAAEPVRRRSRRSTQPEPEAPEAAEQPVEEEAEAEAAEVPAAEEKPKRKPRARKTAKPAAEAEQAAADETGEAEAEAAPEQADPLPDEPPAESVPSAGAAADSEPEASQDEAPAEDEPETEAPAPDDDADAEEEAE